MCLCVYVGGELLLRVIFMFGACFTRFKHAGLPGLTRCHILGNNLIVYIVHVFNYVLCGCLKLYL